MTRNLLLLSFLLILLDGILMTNYHPAKSQPESVEPTVQIQLTSEEKDWLANHKIIHIGVDPDYPPFDFVGENGIHTGIAAKYVRLIEKRLGIPGCAQRAWNPIHRSVQCTTGDQGNR